MSDGWVFKEKGQYRRSEGRFDALVVLDGEWWLSIVFCDGQEIDRGEWDGRATALRNADHAVRRAKDLRDPIGALKRREDGDDE